MSWMIRFHFDEQCAAFLHLVDEVSESFYFVIPLRMIPRTCMVKIVKVNFSILTIKKKSYFSLSLASSLYAKLS